MSISEYIDANKRIIPQVADLTIATFFMKVRSNYSYCDRWRLLMRVARKICREVSLHSLFQDEYIYQIFEECPKALYVGMERTDTPTQHPGVEGELNRFSIKDLQFFLEEYLIASVEHASKKYAKFCLHVRVHPQGYELVDVEIGVDGFDSIEDPIPDLDFMPERHIYTSPNHHLDTIDQP
mgnify:CR=1 FL=1